MSTLRTALAPLIPLLRAKGCWDCVDPNSVHNHVHDYARIRHEKSLGFQILQLRDQILAAYDEAEGRKP